MRCTEMYWSGALIGTAETTTPFPQRTTRLAQTGAATDCPRGGCWYDSAEHCRSAIRRNFAVPHKFVGFRVAAVPVDALGK